ncbi:MAG: hypothetical protein AAB373_03640 [Patescibacteria group bacterium]
MQTTNTIENIKKVALAFFIVTGFLHLGSSIFLANDVFSKEAGIVNKLMDIPFAITGLIYGLAALRLSLSNPEKDHKTLDIILISVIILALLVLVLVNILVPDLQ